MVTFRHMEQLGKTPFEFRGQAKGIDGSLRPFLLKIEQPQLDEDRGFFCDISCPLLGKNGFKIFGFDEDQAIAESFRFIGLLLENKYTVIDDKDEVVPFPSRFTSLFCRATIERCSV